MAHLDPHWILTGTVTTGAWIVVGLYVRHLLRLADQRRDRRGRR